MSNRIHWKKGMRLTSEAFEAMETFHSQDISVAAQLSSAGRFGLFISSRPFHLSVNINGSVLEITALTCTGITRSGRIVDISFRSDYTNTFDTRLAIPTGDEATAFLLLVRMSVDSWRPIDENICEPEYRFELVGENTIIDADCLIVGRLVNHYGWRLDETSFVPPCLFVDAHPLHTLQVERAESTLRSIRAKCADGSNTPASCLLECVWLSASRAGHIVENSRAVMTPQALLAEIRILIEAFVTGCSLDPYISLENYDRFMQYVLRSSDLRNVYRDIEDGLQLLEEICLKIDKVCSMEPVTIPEPAPQPVVSHEPDIKPSSGRRRWMGKEI